MASMRRRALAYKLGAYAHETLEEIRRNAGPFAIYPTAREVVVAHAAHWSDLLHAVNYRTLELETERLTRSVRGLDDELRAYGAACLEALPEGARPVLEAVHASALVACLWHHVYHAAKRGLPLDDAVCRECSNLALKSLRDIVREHAAAAPPEPPTTRPEPPTTAR
jgi:hypothetical protein